MPRTPDSGGDLGIKEMMGSAVGTSTERYARHLGSRLTAAANGRPLKRGDDDPTKLAKLGNEFKAFSWDNNLKESGDIIKLYCFDDIIIS